jgi:hypothetical protein
MSLLITAGQRGDSPQFEAVVDGIRVPRGVAQRGGMAVAGGAAAQVVAWAPGEAAQRGEGPQVAGVGESLVLHPAVHHDQALLPEAR